LLWKVNLKIAIQSEIINITKSESSYSTYLKNRIPVHTSGGGIIYFIGFLFVKDCKGLLPLPVEPTLKPGFCPSGYCKFHPSDWKVKMPERVVFSTQ
jgi:hypothetical protein